ncbi:32677_t:CDS:2, partial [Racocetra persica]
MLSVNDDAEVHQKPYAFSYPTNVNDIGDAKKNSNKKTVKSAKPVKSSKNANSKKANSKKEKSKK